jgi:PAS domain S-box-containing protein
MSVLRILIVDDHEAVRRRVRSLLSSRADWFVCGEAEDGLEAVEKAKRLRPDIVLMDISMSRMDGLQATRIIRRDVPESEVIIISQYDPTVVSMQTAEIDARGYIAKADLSRDLLPTIDRLVGHRNAEITSNPRVGERSTVCQGPPGARFTINAPVPNAGENVTESTVSQKRDAVDTSIPDDAVSLESILCTEELHRRPSRPPDYEKENRALVVLAHALADFPHTVLQTLADTILEVCQAGSAGISLLTTDDNGKRFYWPAIAGEWKSHIGGGTPRDFGPCGDVLDRDTTLLFNHVERRYTYFQPVKPPVEEALLVPFYVEGKAVGTIWAIAHDARRKFDAEDVRLMSSLGKFASSAYQVLGSLDALKSQVAQREKAEAALRQSETTLRDFVETATVALHWVGPDGIVLWANQAELDLLGYAREEYIGHHVAEFYADEPVLSDILGRLNRGETLREYEARLRCKDGSIRHVLIDSSVLFEGGKFVHTRCFTRDITDRKRAEAQLRESERRFREMIDALPAAVYTTDAEGRLTHFNPAAVELFGRVPELGTDQWHVGWKLFRPDGTPLPHDECGMAVAIKEGRIVDWAEVIAERPDGKSVWFTPHPRLLRDAEGRIVGGINMLVDITERKQAERATGLLAAIVDSSDDAIISKSLDGVITSWNKTAERLFGYTAEEAVGQHISLIIPPGRREEETTILERLKQGERIEQFETTRVGKGGRELDIVLTISPVKDAEGRIIGASKVARDISERIQAERALRESEERLRTLADGLETQVRVRTRELEQRNAEVLQQSEQLRKLSNRLLQTQDDERRRIARELHDSAGQIVTALGLNLAGIAQRVGQNPPLGKAMQESQELVQQLSKEIRTVSYLLHPPLLDENGLSEAIRWYMQGLMERSGLEIELSISEDFGRLPGEIELAVFRIVQECLTNIYRHSGGKTARIRLSRNAESVSLEIRDDGKGISAEKLAGIQVRSGVGITGIRERVRHFRGVMNIQSNDSGTTISVSFPVPMTPTSEPESILQQTRAAG